MGTVIMAAVLACGAYWVYEAAYLPGRKAGGLPEGSWSWLLPRTQSTLLMYKLEEWIGNWIGSKRTTKFHILRNNIVHYERLGVLDVAWTSMRPIP